MTACRCDGNIARYQLKMWLVAVRNGNAYMHFYRWSSTFCLKGLIYELNNPPPPHQHGILEVGDGGRVLRLLEKPMPQDTASRLQCPCVYLLQAPALTLLQVRGHVTIKRWTVSEYICVFINVFTITSIFMCLNYFWCI